MTTNKRGRPPQENSRNEHFAFRLSKEELNTLNASASASNETAADFVRQAIAERIERDTEELEFYEATPDIS